MSQPTIMRLMALSINTAKRAGSIIRDVMQKGNLGIVEKVCSPKWNTYLALDKCFLF